MSFADHLMEKFDNVELPLHLKLAVAEKCFLEASFCNIPRREDTILSWLVGELNKEQTPDLWHTLHVCIRSGHTKRLNVTDISVETKASLVEVITTSLKTDPDDPIFRQCASIIMSLPTFHHYFKTHQEHYIRFCKEFLGYLSRNPDSWTLKECIKGFITFYENCSSKDNLLINFIAHLLVLLVDTVKKVDSGKFSFVERELVKALQQILFPKWRFKAYCSSLRRLFRDPQSQCEEKVPKALYLCLLNAVNTCSSDIIIPVFKAVSEPCVETFGEDKETCYKFIVLFTCFLGFQPVVRNSLGTEICFIEEQSIKSLFHRDCMEKDYEISIPVLKNLISLLTEKNMHFTDSYREVSFERWLETLIAEMLSDIPIILMSQILDCACIWNPMVIEPLVERILKIILLQNLDDNGSKEAYKNTMSIIFNVFVKSHQVNKFINELFLPLLKKNIQERKGENVTVFEVIPKRTCIHFGETVTIAPNEVGVQILKNLNHSFHTSLHDAASLEKGNILYVEVLGELIQRVLYSSRIAEHTVPLMTVDKFIHELRRLERCLSHFGSALLKREYSSRLSLCFLNMVYAYGEIIILLMFYSPKNNIINIISIIESDECSATNLSVLHTYLKAEQWNKIAQGVLDSREASCKEIMNKLILQKLRALQLLHTLKNIVQMQDAIIKYIKENIADCWQLLLNCDRTFYHLMTPEQSLSVSESMMLNLVSVGAEIGFKLLANPLVQENKSLVIGLAWAALKRIGKLFKVPKRKRNSSVSSCSSLVTNVLSAVEPEKIFGEDIRALLHCIPNMAEHINSVLEEMDLSQTKVKCNLVDFVTLNQYFSYLKSLPLSFLPKVVKTSVSVVVFSVFICLCEMDMNEDNSTQIDESKKISTDILLALLDGADSVDVTYLNVDVVLKLLHHSKCPHLLRFICHSSVQKVKGLEDIKKLMTRVFSRRRNNEWELQIVAVILDTIKLKKSSPEMKVLCRHIHKFVCKNMLKYMNHVKPDFSSLSINVVIIYSHVLEHYLFSPYHKDVIEYLPDCMELSLNILKTAMEYDERAESVLMFLNVVFENRFPKQSNLEDTLTTEELGVREDFVKKLWAIVTSLPYVSELWETMKGVFVHVTKEEIKDIFDSLQERFHSYFTNYTSVSEKNLKNLLHQWTFLLSLNVDKELMDIGSSASLLVCQQVLNYIRVVMEENCLTDFLTLQCTYVKRKAKLMNPGLADIFLTTIVRIPLTEEYLDLMLPALDIGIKLLSTLVLHWFFIIEDRLPSFLLAYKHVISGVVMRSKANSNPSSKEIHQLLNCTYGIEKLTKTFSENRKRVSFVAIYILADFVTELRKQDIRRDIKENLENAVYLLLGVCDYSDIKHLLRALPSSSLEVFKPLYSDFSKFHRYTGRV